MTKYVCAFNLYGQFVVEADSPSEADDIAQRMDITDIMEKSDNMQVTLNNIELPYALDS